MRTGGGGFLGFNNGLAKGEALEAKFEVIEILYVIQYVGYKSLGNFDSFQVFRSDC